MQNHDTDNSNQNDIWYCKTETTIVLKPVPSILTSQPWLCSFLNANNRRNLNIHVYTSHIGYLNTNNKGNLHHTRATLEFLILIHMPVPKMHLCLK